MDIKKHEWIFIEPIGNGKVEADDVISLAKACFEPLLNAVQKNIEGKLRERRLFP